mmetsp:Transcript_23825/g.35419  ORF Transcript_23825/g.35419 Transcript_23825/m.35419 type:complete len:154 (+) Transcript_23825:104-565(+)
MPNCENEEKIGGQSDEERVTQQEESHSSFVLKTVGVMMSQHAELVSNHVKEVESILRNPDKESWSWGSYDHGHYEANEYGSKLVEQRDKNYSDSLHEINTLRRNIQKITKELHNSKKTIMMTREIAVQEINQNECETGLEMSSYQCARKKRKL